jgi:hypothetical protein
MDLQTAIYEAGARAVLEGRDVYGTVQDNEIREEFISSLMAVHLHRTLNCPVRIERDYTLLWSELGFPVTPDVITKIGAYRADLAVYHSDGKRPIALIEVKKFAEGASTYSIIADLHKGDTVALGEHIGIYGGVLVCETARQNLAERRKVLEDALGNGLLASQPQLSSDGNWKWCFACLRLPLAADKQ